MEWRWLAFPLLETRNRSSGGSGLLAGADAGPPSEFGPLGAWKAIALIQLPSGLPSPEALARLRKAIVR